jgi:hypothetical protein
MADDRRATLEAIAYGSDGRITPGDRIRAIEQLGMLPGPASDRDVPLSVDEVRDELESLRYTCDAALKVMSGPEAIEPPSDEAELRETLDLALEVNAALEKLLAERDRALVYEHRHRLLPAAPGDAR